MSELILIQPNSYHDSVLLMRLTLDLEQEKNISDAIVSMATPHNIELLKAKGFSNSRFNDLGPNDLIVAIRGENLNYNEERLLKKVDSLLESYRLGQNTEEQSVLNLEGALKHSPTAQLALLSIPGEYAARQAHQALDNGLNVMIFSDNVSLKDEIALKEKANANHLLLMGPDCGTAIIQGKPLAFANIIRQGPIGVVGASGTGIQEVTSCIDRLGSGISHAIGTGGRDLKEEVGGLTFLSAIDALARDPQTKVIVAISKPPAQSVAQKVIKRLKATSKPCVIHFVGGEEQKDQANLLFASSLAHCAERACQAAEHSFAPIPDVNSKLIKRYHSELKSSDTLCGLFCGGTTGYEAFFLLSKENPKIFSNLAHDERELKGQSLHPGHVILDLGADEFTQGRPHPMIEPALRNERLIAELENENRKILLFDCVLGYGSHEDPAGILAQGIKTAESRYNRKWITIASVTGTENDPQRFSAQVKTLKDAGIIVMPDNRRAVELAALFLQTIGAA